MSGLAQALALCLSRAIGHSLWQGAVAGGGLWVYLKLARDARPATRYAVACGALLALPALFVATAVGAPFPAWLTTPVALPAAAAAAMARVETMPAAWLAAVWAAGALAVSLYSLGGLMLARQWRAEISEAAPEEWKAALRRLQAAMGTGEVKLGLSRRVNGPCVWGWLRPVILVPAGLAAGMGAEQLEALLAHELAHIRRHDFVVNCGQRVVEAMLFYHPAAWWISRQVTQEREQCCDEAAAELSGDRLGYARALVELAAWRVEGRQAAWGWMPALTLRAAGGSLRQRIARLLQPTTPGAGRAGAAVAALAAALMLLGQGKGAPKAAAHLAEKTGAVRVTVMPRRLATKLALPVEPKLTPTELHPAELPRQWADLTPAPAMLVAEPAPRPALYTLVSLKVVASETCPSGRVLVQERITAPAPGGGVVEQERQGLMPCGVSALDVWRLLI